MHAECHQHSNRNSKRLSSATSSSSSSQCTSASSTFCAYCALRALARVVHSSRPPRVLSPSVIACNLRTVASTFRHGRQEDAHEFVRALLDAIVRADVGGCAATATVPWERERLTDIHRIFGGVLQSSVICRECNHASVISEPFLDLSLEISRVHTLSQALARFTEPETLQGDNRYRCDSCRKLVVAVKRFVVRRAPNVLTLHLKRFDRNKKDPRFIDFPDHLDLSLYMYGKPPGTKARYLLTAVLVHQGSSRQFGHYIAYVRTADGQWLTKDDSFSRTVNFAHVLKQRAYILFYSRTSDTSTRVSQPITEPNVHVPPNKALPEMDNDPSPSSAAPIANPSPLKRAANFAIAVKSLGKHASSPKKDANQPAKKLRSAPSSPEPRPGYRASLGKIGRIAFASRHPSSPAQTTSPTRESSFLTTSKDSIPGSGMLELSEESESDEELVSPKRVKSTPSPFRNFSPVPSPVRTIDSPRSDGHNSLCAVDDAMDDLPPVPRKAPREKRSASEGQPPRLLRGANANSDKTNRQSDSESANDSDNSNCIRGKLLISGGESARKAVRRAFGLLNGSRGEKRRNSDSTGVSSKDLGTEKSGSRRESWKGISRAKSTLRFGRGGGASARSSREHDANNVVREDVNPNGAPQPSGNLGGSSLMFGAEGVDRWETGVALPEPEKVTLTKNFARPRILKRRRANDEMDAEYDRGKQRRVRGRGGQRGGFGRNPFEGASDRRRKSR